MAAIPAAAIQSEIDRRNDFVYSRLQRRGSVAELKDLTDFMHGEPAPLMKCAVCGLLVRGEQQVRSAGDYEGDANDLDLMAQVYPRYVDFFRNKTEAFRDRLSPHASVLELGSHLGGFLQVAEEWNWRPLGLDIGRDTSEFARKRGLMVRRELLEDMRVPNGGVEALFIWNCFEQLEDPAPTLDAAYRLLRPHGLLVLRVPNAAFYLEQRETELNWLEWNNLLGFPYLYGYTTESLNRLALRHGFEPVRGFNSELLTTPFADLSTAVAAEQKAVSEDVCRWSSHQAREHNRLSGPWIEVIYRKQSEAQRLRPRIDVRFLERAS